MQDLSLARECALAAAVLAHVECRSDLADRRLAQLRPGDPEAAPRAAAILRDLRRMRASLALIETYLCDLRRTTPALRMPRTG